MLLFFFFPIIIIIFKKGKINTTRFISPAENFQGVKAESGAALTARPHHRPPLLRLLKGGPPVIKNKSPAAFCTHPSTHKAGPTQNRAGLTMRWSWSKPERGFAAATQSRAHAGQQAATGHRSPSPQVPVVCRDRAPRVAENSPKTLPRLLGSVPRQRTGGMVEMRRGQLG